MSVALSLSPRNLYGLLTALGKRLFSDEESLSNDELAQELSLSSTEIICIEQLLKKAAVNNWGEDSLTAEIVEGSNDFSFTADQMTVFAKFWRDNKEKIAKVLQSRSTYNNRYENMNWRVDMKVASRKYSDINEPTAFFEVITSGGSRAHPNPHLFQKLDGNGTISEGRNGHGKSSSSKICFEMNQQELKDTIAQLALVHKAVEEVN